MDLILRMIVVRLQCLLEFRNNENAIYTFIWK